MNYTLLVLKLMNIIVSLMVDMNGVKVLRNVKDHGSFHV